MGQRRFDVAVFLLCAGALSGCGGGGGSSTPQGAQQVLPPASTPLPASGPVSYLQSSGGAASGTILAGAHQALIAVMSGAAAPGSYASDSFTVSAGGASTATRTLAISRPQAARPERLAPVEAFPADDRALIGRMQQLRSGAVALARQPQSVEPAAYGVGSTASIWVQKGALGGNRTNVQVPATLLYQSQHVNLWIDSTLQFTQAQLAQIDADAENAYASDTQHFASPDYTSGAPALQAKYTACAPGGASQGTSAAYIDEPADRRIDVMVVNSSNLGGLGGYFSAANLMTQATLNCLNGSGTQYESNQAPFIFVGWFAGSGAAYDLQEDLVRSTAHELQHLINFVNHGILASGASSTSFNGYEQTYVNEGLSMLAQDFAVQRMYGSSGVQFDVDDALSRANVYLSGPSNYSLSAFSGIDPVAWGGNGSPQYNCGGGCYGVAYLFQRYLYDRFGGDAYAHAVETSGVTGQQNLQRATGESVPSLFGDFALAMAANALGVTSNDPRFDFGTLNLSGAYRDQSGITTQLGGLSTLALSSGSANVNAPVGGFAFVGLNSVPASGAAVDVTDRATAPGFALEGGLATK